jgi:hypothetical protein
LEKNFGYTLNSKPLNNNMSKPNNNKSMANIIAIVMSVGLIFLVLSLGSNSDFNPLSKEVKVREFADLLSDIRAKKVSKIEISENKDRAKVELYKELLSNRQ